MESGGGFRTQTRGPLVLKGWQWENCLGRSRLPGNGAGSQEEGFTEPQEEEDDGRGQAGMAQTELKRAAGFGN